jgi:hypothetical protein
MKIDLFSIPTNTLPVVVTATASTSTALPNKGNTIRIVNEGPNVAFVSIGTGTQTATLPNATPTATSNPIYVGETTLSIPPDSILNISAICRASQTAQLNIQVGEGS